MRRREFREKPSANHTSDTFFKSTVQKKLSVGQPGDKFEKEADNVADKVVNKSDSGNIQRAEMPGNEEKLQQKPLADSISTVQAKELNQEETVQQAAEKKEDEQKIQPKEEDKKEDPTLQKKEEEEKVPVQQAAEKKEDEQKIQPKEEEKKEDPTLQKKEEEEKVPVQQAAEKKEDEQKIQPKEEEKKEDPTLQKKEEEEKVPVQQAAEKKEDEPKIQSKEEDQKEEKPLQTKKEVAQKTQQTEKLLVNSKGAGASMSQEVQQEMESGFGADLSNVRIHTDTNAVQMSQQMGAQAFTHGNDIYFNKGKYNPDSKAGKHLLAHEITHTIQQNGGGSAVQKKHTPDTGWRYTLPSTVTRSVIEIQGIVNATPDGVYGVDTKNAVEDYQRVLKSAGLYSGDIDGKWGALTDVAHASYALRRPYRAGYNCAGFAFKKFSWIDYLPTKSILAGMTKLAGHSSKTSPYHYKFWFWDIKVAIRDKFTGVTSAASDDFHIVGGQTDGKGEGPDKVMSKNGERPVEGPKSPLDWEVKSGPALDQDGNALSRYDWVISSSKLSVHSNKDLP